MSYVFNPFTGNLDWTVPATVLTGANTVAGTNGQIQYNASGAFGGALLETNGSYIQATSDSTSHLGSELMLNPFVGEVSAPEIMGFDILGHHPFSGTITDSSPSALNGTAHNVLKMRPDYSLANYVIGFGGYAAGFFGGSTSTVPSYISLPAGVANNLTSWTIAFLICLEENTQETIFSRQHDGSNSMAIVSVGYTVSGGGGFTAGTAGQISFHAANGRTNITSATSLSNKKWYLVIIDGNGSTGNIYIENVLDATQATNQSIPNDASPTSVSLGAWLSGGPTDTSAMTELFGRLGYFAVYNKVLSSGERSALYNGGSYTIPASNASGLVYLAKFQDAAATTNGYVKAPKLYAGTLYADSFLPGSITTASLTMTGNIDLNGHSIDNGGYAMVSSLLDSSGCHWAITDGSGVVRIGDPDVCYSGGTFQVDGFSNYVSFFNITGVDFGNANLDNGGQISAVNEIITSYLWVKGETFDSAGTNGSNGDIFTANGSGSTWKSRNTLKLPTPLFDHFADVNNGTTVETDLYSDTIAANQLANNGDKIEAIYGGTFTGSGTSTQELRLYFGGTVILDTGALSIGVATDSWSVYVIAIRESASIVRCSVSLTTNFATLSAYSKYTKVTGLTLANTQILKVTGQAGGVGGASNQITASEGFVSYVPAA